MARKSKDYSSAFSIRLSKEERAKLDAAAGDMPIGTYIRSRLFDTPSPRRHPRKYRPDIDRAALNKLLRELGRQHIASNLTLAAVRGLPLLFYFLIFYLLPAKAVVTRMGGDNPVGSVSLRVRRGAP